MRRFAMGLLLLFSLLMPPGGTVLCAESPSSPPLQLLTAPASAQNTPRAEEIRDIKGPVPLPERSRYLLPALAVAVLVFAAVLLFLFLKRRRKPLTVAASPEITALAELDHALRLRDAPLVYAERISHILRQYIEARFQIPSTRQTTREFFSRLHSGTIAELMGEYQVADLQECLEQCDIAKFARGTPDQEQMMRMDQAVRSFIETTRQPEAA